MNGNTGEERVVKLKHHFGILPPCFNVMLSVTDTKEVFGLFTIASLLDRQPAGIRIHHGNPDDLTKQFPGTNSNWSLFHVMAIFSVVTKSLFEQIVIDQIRLTTTCLLSHVLTT